MLEVRELSVEVSGRTVVKEASFSIRAGDKVGLVGKNGAGKTSLMRVLVGETQPASGVVLSTGALGYVTQNLLPGNHGQGCTALAHVLSGRDLDRLSAALHEAQAGLEANPDEAAIEGFSHAEEAFRHAGGYQAESEVGRITSGLGLGGDRLELDLAALSGGERRRVDLARVLFAGSDLLLLDEPTNHLDKSAKEWLMGFLRAHRGGLLVVSHDLELLDSAITRVLHLDEGTVRAYRGTYSKYVEARKRDEERLAKTAVRQQGEVVRLTTLADVMRRQSAKRAKTAHSLDKRVERLKSTMVEARGRERKIKIRFPEPPHSGRMVFNAEGLSKSYGGPSIFTDVSFAIRKGERILIMGFNGAGKTTLLKILAGQMPPDAGSFRLGSGVAAGYYAQQHEGIDGGASVLANMYKSSDEPEPQVRALLGMFGLTGDVGRQTAGTLSGGEKTKLALAQLVAGRHNLLLLDEPTNNLDPPSRTAVANALGAWPGSMIIVSHDQEFVEALVPHRVVVMPEGREEIWDESMLDFVAMA